MKKIDNTDINISPEGFAYRNGKQISFIKTNKGYLNIRPTINGKKTYFSIHREVAKAYIPNPNNLPQVGHEDHNKLNNNVNNLYWTNNSENQDRNRQIGKGVGANSRSKLTIEDVRWIRSNIKPFDSEYGYYALAKKFGVWPREIQRIVKKERWLID